jgi:FAD-dependent oxidoreductase domain-containing protein 1
MEVGRKGIERVRLDREGWVGVGAVVNAAGPQAAQLAGMAGISDYPVRPRKRFVFRFHCRERVEGAPLTIDPGGVYFRPEGPDFLSGVSPSPDNDPDAFDLRVDHSLFQEVVWPTLAHRVPAFQAVRPGHSWAGLYAVNTIDRNAILGSHPRVPNLFLANGFSGHGLQHSPAVGRALSELILDGAYQTLDLSRFSYERFADGELCLERNVV